MEVTEGFPKRQWGRRREPVGRALAAPTAAPAPFDLAPPPWAARLVAGAAQRLVARADSVAVTVHDAGRFTLATARVGGASALDDPSFERCTAEAYRALADVVRARPARHPLRFWNHIPAIRRSDQPGLDRYMVFNAGRYAACSDWFGSPDAFDRLLPTASAVGHDGHDLVVHALAGEEGGVAVENPRQVPSYRYSRRFGPRPPCFARGTSVRWHESGGATILVGGTASIRGEDSVHRGDLRAQAHETFENLGALVRSAGAPGLGSFESLRVYYVHAADRDAITRTVAEAFPHLRDVEYVTADLCRPELLVEIEGVACAGL
jgi:enamine deaminase RidA (YjgF/YER057c/UK114 family)